VTITYCTLTELRPNTRRLTAYQDTGTTHRPESRRTGTATIPAITSVRRLEAMRRLQSGKIRRSQYGKLRHTSCRKATRLHLFGRKKQGTHIRRQSRRQHGRAGHTIPNRMVRRQHGKLGRITRSLRIRSPRSGRLEHITLRSQTSTPLW
jgi:hypothetical protein